MKKTLALVLIALALMACAAPTPGPNYEATLDMLKEKCDADIMGWRAQLGSCRLERTRTPAGILPTPRIETAGSVVGPYLMPLSDAAIGIAGQTVPAGTWGVSGICRVDTVLDGGAGEAMLDNRRFVDGQTFEVPDRSLVVVRKEGAFCIAAPVGP